MHADGIGCLLFAVGAMGVLVNRKNILIMVMAIELMVLAVVYCVVIYSIALDNMVGQIAAIIVLTVAAAESAIGLSIIVTYHRARGTIAVRALNLLRG